MSEFCASPLQFRIKSGFTPHNEVSLQAVSWEHEIVLPQVDAYITRRTDVLQDNILRLSVRQETRGGTGHDRLGFVLLNLSEYCVAEGQSSTTLRLLLQESRMNSSLKVTINSEKVEGPMFVPAQHNPDEVDGGAVLGDDEEVIIAGEMRRRGSTKSSEEGDVVGSAVAAVDRPAPSRRSGGERGDDPLIHRINAAPVLASNILSQPIAESRVDAVGAVADLFVADSSSSEDD